jgi:hypothetical protein
VLDDLDSSEALPELPEEIHQQIVALCEQADTLAEADDFPGALELYWQAWDLLPQPVERWEAATWILAAIGDANFLGGDFTAGRDNLATAMHCPAAIGNPFLHLRLGQCQFELGNLNRAADELTRAFMGAGSAIFEGEPPKYFEFLKTQIDPPVEGW